MKAIIVSSIVALVPFISLAGEHGAHHATDMAKKADAAVTKTETATTDAAAKAKEGAEHHAEKAKGMAHKAKADAKGAADAMKKDAKEMTK